MWHLQGRGLSDCCRLAQDAPAERFRLQRSQSVRISVQGVKHSGQSLRRELHDPWTYRRAQRLQRCRAQEFSGIAQRALQQASHSMGRTICGECASLCVLPSSLLGADPFLCHTAILGPNLCVLRPSHLDRACLSLLASLFSLLSALFPLLSLLLISQIALRTCHFELCIRPSNPLPTVSALSVTVPGPAECAKR